MAREGEIGDFLARGLYYTEALYTSGPNLKAGLRLAREAMCVHFEEKHYLFPAGFNVFQPPPFVICNYLSTYAASRHI